MSDFVQLTPAAAVGGFLASVASVSLLLSLAMRFGFNTDGRAPMRIDSEHAASLLPVHAAAARAYEQAKDKDMVIAFIAERNGGDDGPVGWIERSIVRVVPVYKHDPEADAYVQANVRNPEEGLYVREKELRRYMRWAKAMQ